MAGREGGQEDVGVCVCVGGGGGRAGDVCSVTALCVLGVGHKVCGWLGGSAGGGSWRGVGRAGRGGARGADREIREQQAGVCGEGGAGRGQGG